MRKFMDQNRHPMTGSGEEKQWVWRTWHAQTQWAKRVGAHCGLYHVKTSNPQMSFQVTFWSSCIQDTLWMILSPWSFYLMQYKWDCLHTGWLLFSLQPWANKQKVGNANSVIASRPDTSHALKFLSEGFTVCDEEPILIQAVCFPLKTSPKPPDPSS